MNAKQQALWIAQFVICLFISALRIAAQEPIEITVWPNGAPGLAEGEKREIVVTPDEQIGQRVTKVTDPKLTVYRPDSEQDTGASVVICPGGGYNILALQHEGIDVAKWLNGIGVTGIVLQYRVPRSKTQSFQTPPLQDAQRTLRLARHHADEWGIDPKRIGILGFSAGGNLTALAATNFQQETYEPIDAADQQSSRPDFAVLVYPAYLNDEQNPTELKDNVPVTDKTPPSLLIHTGDDRISSENSIAFYLALKKAGVPVEMHLYPSGGHGYGLRSSQQAVSTWPDRAERWMRDLGVLGQQPAK